ncbi:MAG: hypothetical protein PHD04_01960 [Candidatus Pacebacteria bacterium]|nr:hypothetical protein [Candidatus Paceibacterota bacterium]
MSNPLEGRKMMHPHLERIMNKVKAEHPHVPIPEVETPEVPLKPVTRVVITPEMRHEAELRDIVDHVKLGEDY